jgi:hypothetical protein
MPAAGVPVAPVAGFVDRDDHFVTLARTDLVVAAGTPIRLVGLVRLDVTDLDSAMGFRPTVRAHTTVTVLPRNGALGEG